MLSEFVKNGKGSVMAYTLEERETIVRYDEMDKCWYFESNVRRHVTKILKMSMHSTKSKKSSRMIFVSMFVQNCLI